MKYICILILLLSGCKLTENLGKNSVIVGSTGNTISWVWKIIPGYRKRTLRKYDFYIEREELKLRLDELRNDRRGERLKYNKLSIKEPAIATEK